MMRFLSNRWMHFTLLSALVLVSMVFSFSQQGIRHELQSYVFDYLNKEYPRPKTDQVVIVDYDDYSLQNVGQWPWPRQKIAELIENLTQMEAAAIVFDGVLPEADGTSPDLFAQTLPNNENFLEVRQKLAALGSNDEILANAIRRSNVFVSGFTLSSYTQSPREPIIVKPILAKKSIKESFLSNAEHFKAAATFLPMFEKASAGNGSFIAAPDTDGVIRRTGLIFSNNKNIYPALSLEALRVARTDQKTHIKIGNNPDTNSNLIESEYKILLGDYKIPVERNGKIWVYYRVFDEQADDYVSAYKILDPAQKKTVAHLIKNKIVLIGSSAEGLKDLRSTAIEPFQPGVEIHANVIEQILQGTYLQRPHITVMAEANFILFVGVLLVLMAPFVSVVATGVISVGFIAAAFAASKIGYIEHGYLIDPIYPSLCVFLIFVTSTILTYLRTEYERGQIRDAFGLYISPEYMQELTENPDKLKLGGENRELSVMFTDIRNFTSISEGLSPQELIQLINDFLTPMSDLVMQNKGTIDKYMGDAMMAFWNAPLDDADHAKHACLTALGMQAALEPINRTIHEHAKELGKDPILLNAGIGINTGECAVGNMGSRQRFAYSTLGDAVNMASRLEAQTKNYGIGILIGEKTYGYVSEFACLEVDLLQVKGKTQSEKVYGLIGEQALQQTENFQNLLSLHQAMITKYRETKFDDAKALCFQCEELDIYGLEKLYSLYKARIKQMKENPPPADWDGVYIAQTK